MSRAVWFGGWSPGGRGLGGGEAELEEHLGVARQCELAADEVAGYGVFQRLGVQGREYLLAGGVQQQPVQGLPGAQPASGYSHPFTPSR